MMRHPSKCYEVIMALGNAISLWFIHFAIVIKYDCKYVLEGFVGTWSKHHLLSARCIYLLDCSPGQCS